MILLIYSLKQKQTRKRVIDRGAQPTQSSNLSSKKRAVVPKRLIQLLGRCLLLNILRTFSQNTFMVGRNKIHRSYPILSYHFYPGLLVIIVP